MRLLFPAADLSGLINSLNPKEEALGDCVEICLGVLRTALMYEGCGSPLFNWKDIHGVLTGLETSFVVVNATACASGLNNRKMNSNNSSRGKSLSLSFDDFQKIPLDIVPERRCPVMPTNDQRMATDVTMSDATQTPTPTEGKVVEPVTPSTDAGKGSYVSAPGVDASKRRRVTPQMEAKSQLENALECIQRMLANEAVCRNCISTEHSTSECPKPEANE